MKILSNKHNLTKKLSLSFECIFSAFVGNIKSFGKIEIQYRWNIRDSNFMVL